MLYDLQYWEIICIIRGYRRRDRTPHILARQLAFWLVKSSMAKTDEIVDPADMWHLPWDDEDLDDEPISQSDHDDLVALINAANAHLSPSKEESAAP